ncbi:sensor histidine kinase [Paenibacillus puldeungensis]|uniref:histidine kinase n=1 Tax=Paenibacillus puldeungensis TaxID=696536 RepID=A0ABW3RYZ8_9BACL
MELWTIGNKMLVLGFIIVISYFAASQPSPWLVLYFLLYVALNLTALIFKRQHLKLATSGLVLVYVVVCSLYVQPEMILLLPLTLSELAAFYIRRQIAALALLLFPVVFIQRPLLFLYIFLAVVSMFNSILVSRYSQKISKQEKLLDKMRVEQEKLRKQLNENQEFIRVSEYTYKLEERSRLSQEIHDGIGHSMTGALIQMEAAKRLLHSDPPSAEKLLQNAIGIAKESIEKIRQTLKNIKPPVQQLGIHRLKTAVEGFGTRSDLQVSVVHGGDLERITPLYWKIIHDNVTEALTNTAKYASATTVHVEVRVLSKLIKVVVSDNGRGQAKIVKGLGLLGMEERTASVNGTVIADGTQGFSVTTLIPCGGDD